ncbi:hypothetical protein M0G74_06405 [Microbulbifer sp. CAU 1566]|uniref:hypothetical protein n=1 Tax=Microbulbifer sp. CAU 1566 TaxID=2933269 RepID=UPI0020051992|nr:hypothetical protein [Microbulbifer sp. CAU 1566]MCK7596901.1 hypothetical protein [Microbulbifer sp. CAU 1566]
MKVWHWIVSTIILITGIYIGALYARLPILKLNREVDIIELGNLFVVFSLAILAPYLITNRIDTDRHKKNLLIEEVSIFNRGLEKLENTLHDLEGRTLDQADCSKVYSHFKKLGAHLTSLAHQVGESRNYRPVKGQVENLQDELTNYWDYVTGTKGIKPTNFILSGRFLLRQSVHHEKTLDSSRRLKFTINNS